MPYIKTEVVKQIRKQIKATYPKYKWSVTIDNHDTVAIALLESDLSFEKSYIQINHFYIDEHYASQPTICSTFNKVLDIVNDNQPRRIVSEDSDYGSIPNYYISLQVGKWDKPHIKTA